MVNTVSVVIANLRIFNEHFIQSLKVMVNELVTFFTRMLMIIMNQLIISSSFVFDESLVLDI